MTYSHRSGSTIWRTTIKEMITKEIQTRLFDEYGTPERVRRHCDAVTACAVRLGQALNAARTLRPEEAFNAVRPSLDMELIEGAARVHDVARTAERHDDAGVDFLCMHGFEKEAALVREHTRHPFHPLPEIDELDVLCMADRIVREDAYVGIEKRVEYLLGKPSMTEKGRELLRGLMEDTKKYFGEIEDIIGMSLDELLGDIHP